MGLIVTDAVTGGHFPYGAQCCLQGQHIFMQDETGADAVEGCPQHFIQTFDGVAVCHMDMPEADAVIFHIVQDLFEAFHLFGGEGASDLRKMGIDPAAIQSGQF